MSKQIEALKLALEALEYEGLLKRKQAITAIREALAEQPAQQPYGWVRMNVGAFFKTGVFNLGADCPTGWVGGAVPVYSEQLAQHEIEELTAQRDQLADILTRTANALKGQPAELSLHSWHDLPEVAQQLKAAQPHEPVAWMDGYRNIYSLEEKAAGCPEATIALVPLANQEKTSGSLILEDQEEEQQPNGVVLGFTEEGKAIVDHDGLEEGWVLYTSPPASKPWVGLTDDERAEIFGEFGLALMPVRKAIAEDIEAKLREKNA